MSPGWISHKILTILIADELRSLTARGQKPLCRPVMQLYGPIQTTLSSVDHRGRQSHQKVKFLAVALTAE